MQQWDTQKKCERFAKINFKLQDPDGISAIAPAPYAERFIQSMFDITEPDDDELDALNESLEVTSRANGRVPPSQSIDSTSSRAVLLDAPRSLNDDSEVVVLSGDIALSSNQERYFG